ncbi:MerR family transcriptional regulator [bacterium]|nr:MerR family transcriptional regulator [bacterium]
MAKIPDKMFFRIGEVGKITGVKPYVLRYWESEFKLLRPIKNKAGQRIYRRRDIETVLDIKNLLYKKKYTIAGAKKKLSEESHSRAAQQMELGFTPPHIKAIAGKIREELVALEKFLR